MALRISAPLIDAGWRYTISISGGLLDVNFVRGIVGEGPVAATLQFELAFNVNTRLIQGFGRDVTASQRKTFRNLRAASADA